VFFHQQSWSALQAVWLRDRRYSRGCVVSQGLSRRAVMDRAVLTSRIGLDLSVLVPTARYWWRACMAIASDRGGHLTTQAGQTSASSVHPGLDNFLSLVGLGLIKFATGV